jgi:hypothetical protein
VNDSPEKWKGYGPEMKGAQSIFELKTDPLVSALSIAEQEFEKEAPIVAKENENVQMERIEKANPMVGKMDLELDGSDVTSAFDEGIRAGSGGRRRLSWRKFHKGGAVRV